MSENRDTSGLKSALQGVLVIANSGRMLADAVSRADLNPLVIDLFADQDTDAIAEQLWQVENLSLVAVQEIVEHIVLSYKILWVVYGSGLENYPETLEYLADCFSVMGNDYSVIKHLCAKKTFFKQLDILDIQHPEVQFYPPENSEGWLIKPTSHVGGLGIGWCSRAAGDNEYYQKFCQGEAGSVLFCADGEQFEVIGFHRQWTVNHDDFTFSGIVQEALLPVEQQQAVQCWLKKLVSYYHLKGLASVDFIWDGNACYFLEINPRPPASMMLYPELDLLTAHITGSLDCSDIDKTIQALQIVYAKQPCEIRQTVWPEWSFDQPWVKTSIQVNEPVCTILAQGQTVQQALDSLLAKQIIIENNLY